MSQSLAIMLKKIQELLKTLMAQQDIYTEI
jgi:hypothetical protein